MACRNPEQVKMVDRRSGMIRAAVASYLIILLLVVMVACLVVALVMQKEKNILLQQPFPGSRPCSVLMVQPDRRHG